ncbi:MAG TPA: sulfotransferase family 2 domain-containing protein [Thermoanaerobaculia bacterium]|nr:sulfotransferase family 2 domain-containing protein [Thermoanaerobaculia bacterium]
MILCDRERYVFVELPHTASTAVAAELCANYGGRAVLHKHARYHQFLSQATPAQRRYFVFSGVRNPLDEAVSYYFRYKTDHQGRYSDPTNWKRNGGSVSDHSVAQYLFIRDHQADFPTYVRRFYRKPYDNWSNLAHRRMDFVIRFENLQTDFAAVLGRLGIEPVRPLPVVNKTAQRRHAFWDYYPPDLRPWAARTFGPFLLHWGYRLPPEWGALGVPWTSRLVFHALRPMRQARWRILGARLFD